MATTTTKPRGRLVDFVEFHHETTLRRTKFYELIANGVLTEAALPAGGGKRIEKKLVTRESFDRFLNGGAPPPRKRKGVVAQFERRRVKPQQLSTMRIPHFQ